MKKIELTDREIEIILRAILEDKRFLEDLVHNHKRDQDYKKELVLVNNIYEKLRFKKRGVK